MPIIDFLIRNANLYGDEVSLIEINPEEQEKHGRTWRDYELVETTRNTPGRTEITWKDFDCRANRFANLLLSRGFGKGDKVAILLMNCIEWLPIYFGALKAGYANGTPKAIAGWAALKKSINVDLDPSCLIGGMIVTNQSGFACLDEEVDGNGRPILQENPANRTQKLFQGLPIHVFPDAQLPNIDGTHFPIIYGDTKAGCTFVEHQSLEFALSDQYLFGKNQNCLRVIEGFDVMSTDTSAYIYGSLTASAKA